MKSTRRVDNAASGEKCASRRGGAAENVLRNELAGQRLNLSVEELVAALVDDLLALGDGEGGGVVLARVLLGADEAVLLHALRKVLLDHAGSLELALGAIGGGADAEALIFDRLAGGLLGRRRRRCRKSFRECPSRQESLPLATTGVAIRDPLKYVAAVGIRQTEALARGTDRERERRNAARHA